MSVCYGQVAELVDAAVSEAAARKGVRVRVPLCPQPNAYFQFGRVAELADAVVLGTTASACGFESRLAHKSFGRVAELVDATDLKFVARKGVRVRFPPRLPNKCTNDMSANLTEILKEKISSMSDSDINRVMDEIQKVSKDISSPSADEYTKFLERMKKYAETQS